MTIKICAAFLFCIVISTVAQAGDEASEILDAVRECAIRESIIADDGYSPIEKATDSVRVLCSLTSSRLYSLYQRSGWLNLDSGKESLKQKQENANAIIKSVVLTHREQLLLRRNGQLGEKMKDTQSIVKQCALTNAKLADDYISDAKTIAINLAIICSKEYEMYVDAYAVMTFEDESMRAELKRGMLTTEKKTEVFLTPVVINRKAHQTANQIPSKQ